MSFILLLLTHHASGQVLIDMPSPPPAPPAAETAPTQPAESQLMVGALALNRYVGARSIPRRDFGWHRFPTARSQLWHRHGYGYSHFGGFWHFGGLHGPVFIGFPGTIIIPPATNITINFPSFE